MYHRILVPLDGSATSERGLMEAIRLARVHDSRLMLLHLIEDFPTMRESASIETLDIMEARRRHAGEALLNAAAKAARHARVPMESSVLFTRDTVSQTIVDMARCAPKKCRPAECESC